MMTLRLAALLAIAACGPETTSFRTTDRSDASQRAAYDLGIASVRVSSTGGYISTTEEPMTHVAFEIQNRGGLPLVFDSDALRLIALDKYGVPVATSFVAITPLGPAQLKIAPGATAELDAYFRLQVRPRVVDSMRVQWSVRAGDRTFTETTSFTRDDDYPVSEPPGRRAEPESRTSARI